MPNTQPSINTKVKQIEKLLAQGKIKDAKALYSSINWEELIAQDTNTPLLQSLGYISMQLHDNSQSIEIFARLVELEPDNPSFLTQLAAALSNKKRFNEAIPLLRKSLDIDPDHGGALINLGTIYVDLHDYDRAISVLERAKKQHPRNGPLLLSLAIAYNNCGDNELALEAAQLALRCDPNTHHTHHYMGTIYSQEGQSALAIKCFNKAIEINPLFGPSYQGISGTKKFTQEDLQVVESIEAALTKSMPATDRAYIHFALGKIYDDLKEWNKAFTHFRQGNLLRKDINFIDGAPKALKIIRKKILPTLNQKNHYAGNPSEVPVFILGMPRTGSTLTEQIIANHPMAESAGEMVTLNKIFSGIATQITQKPALKQQLLSPETLEKHAQNYLNDLQLNRSHALKIIDKSPGNFIFIPLILKLFPNAKIIHTIRHPLDTCWSCYSQAFTELMWASDLKWLANSYRFYRKTMHLWKKALPVNSILDVHYEQLVADPEQESRKIIAWCGLDWHPNCLNFNKRKSTVRTASLWQVRQPIYQSSKMRWVNYAPSLLELANSIRPYLTENDALIFAEQGLKLRNISILEKLQCDTFD